MKMKMKLLFVPIVMVMMSVPGVTTFIREPRTTSTTWTTGAINLNGKMFTLSSDGGGISFYPPSTTTPTPETTTEWTTTNYETTSPPKTTTPTPETTTEWTTTNYETTSPPKTTTPTPETTTEWTTTPRTTPFSTTGLSVCLRYLTDYSTTRDPPLLQLFPSSWYPMTLRTSSGVFYSLTWDGAYRQTFQPFIQFWPGGFAPDIWTRVCVTVDTVKKVAQVFSGSNMSIRKMLPYQFPQGQDPQIYVPGFDGQLTDVQMWDYPLSYREIIQYMRPSTYRPSRGSVLTWSDISYSLNGYALLEDTYEMQEQQPIRKRGRGRGLRGEKKSRMVF